MNSGVEERGNLDGFYAYKDTFDPDNVWVEVPRASQTPNVGLGEGTSLKVGSHFCARLGSLCYIIKPGTRR